MKSNTLIVLAMLLLSSPMMAQNGPKNFIDQPYIEVTGQVETEIVPNLIYVSIVLNEQDKKGRISIEAQENQLITKLRQCDIDIDKQFSVDDFDGYYRRKFLGDDVYRIKRYQLVVYDGLTLGKVFKELDALEVSKFSIVKVDHSEMETFKTEAKIKALKIARKRAESYANSIGQNIGKALLIKDSSKLVQVSNPAYAMEMNMSRRYSEAVNDIDVKKIVITENVDAYFILE